MTAEEPWWPVGRDDMEARHFKVTAVEYARLGETR